MDAMLERVSANSKPSIFKFGSILPNSFIIKPSPQPTSRALPCLTSIFLQCIRRKEGHRIHLDFQAVELDLNFQNVF